MVTKFKDAIGQPIKIGDVIIVVSQGSRYGVDKEFVVKATECKIKTNSSGNLSPKSCVVITDQLIANGEQGWMDKERAKLKFDTTPPVAKKQPERCIIVKCRTSWEYDARFDYFVIKCLGTSQANARDAASKFMGGIIYNRGNYVTRDFLDKDWKDAYYPTTSYAIPHSFKTLGIDKSLAGKQVQPNELPEDILKALDK